MRTRAGVVGNLEALDAAGVALRWVRHLFPPRTPEPEGWRVLVELLDVLDARRRAPRAASSRAPGSRCSRPSGYALDLERCVVCGRPCPESKAACVDPARGGLVCRSCGGASAVLLPDTRAAARALASGRAADVTASQAESLLQIVDRGMAAHAGFER